MAGTIGFIGLGVMGSEMAGKLDVAAMFLHATGRKP